MFLQTERGGLGLNVAIDLATTESMCRKEGATLSSKSPFPREGYLMIIKLTHDIEQALAEEARKLGTTPEQLALDSLRERFVGREPPSPAREPETLADFLCGHLGVLHSSEHVPGGARMSEASGKKFTAGLLAQRQQRRP